MKLTQKLIFPLTLLLLWLGSFGVFALDSNIPENTDPYTPPPEETPGNTDTLVEMLDLSEHELVLKPKGFATLKVTLTPSAATVKSVTFVSGNEEIATVDSRGKVTGVSVGTTTITVTSDSNPSATDICLVTVEPVTLTRLSITTKKITMGLGARQPLSLTTAPAGAELEAVSYYSDNPMICSVDSKGNLYADSPGTANITVTSGVLTATCTVTVNPTPSFQLAIGKSKNLKMTGTARSVLWSSDNTYVVSVDSGRVTANGYGVASVTAEDLETGRTQVWTVGVLNYVKQLIVPSRTLALYCDFTSGTGQSHQLTPSVLPADATDLGYTYKSSHPDIVSVSGSGMLTARSPGRAKITVMSLNGNRKVPVNVTVYAAPSAFALEKSDVTLSLGRRAALKLDIGEGSSKKGVIWKSSDPGIVSVGLNGTLIGKGVGTVTVSAEIPGIAYDEAIVSVVVPIQTMTLNEKSVVLPVYASINLAVKITPDNASGAGIRWESSNEEVATVDENGKVTARGSGTARIIAVSESGRRASCTIRVPRPNTQISRLDRR